MISKERLDGLVLRLQNGSVEERLRAAQELFDLGEQASEAVPALIRAADRDDDHRTRHKAASTLGRIGPRAAEAVQPLLRILRNPAENGTLRRHAAYMLGLIGQPAEAALIERLRDPDLLVRKVAASALHKRALDRSAAVPALVDTLNDCDEGVGHAAFSTLDQILPADTPILEQLISDPRPMVSSYGSRLMLQRHPSHEGAVEALVRNLSNPSSRVRRAAAVSLGEAVRRSRRLRFGRSPRRWATRTIWYACLRLLR